MNTDTLTGQTTRPVTFSVKDQNKVVVEIQTFPAGTEVYAKPTREGFSIRIPGTLFTQRVTASAVEPF